MEQSPQNPGAPAQGSAVQGSPLPENTAQSNAVQENTVQNNAAESTTVEATAVPTATALQSPAQDPAVDWCRIRGSCRGGSTRARRA